MYQQYDSKQNTMGTIEEKADIALIGLAVMGQNLILNMNDHGFVVRLQSKMLCFCITF